MTRESILSLLSDAQERADKATPGPWQIPGANIFRVIATGPMVLIVGDSPENAYFGRERITYADKMRGDQAGPQEAADRRFIAESRTLVPALIAAVRGEVERHKPILEGPADLHGWCTGGDHWFADCPTIQRISDALSALGDK